MANENLVIGWRADFASEEANQLHADAFDTRVFSIEEWDWRNQVEDHSLGWVTARSLDGELVGFVNVISDGFVHAWIQDVMVASAARHQGIGVAVVAEAQRQAAAAGCEWLHVDFDAELAPFYFGSCGFEPTTAGLIDLTKASG